MEAVGRYSWELVDRITLANCILIAHALGEKSDVIVLLLQGAVYSNEQTNKRTIW
jgi:hypothetical protein